MPPIFCRTYDIRLSFNDHTRHYFVDFLVPAPGSLTLERSTVISIKITEGQAYNLAKALKISIGVQ